MKKLLILFMLILLPGCASLGLGGGNAQPVNTIMQVLSVASTFAANGCIPAIATADHALACAPVTSSDQSVITQAFNACLTATATQLLLANVKVPKCQVVPVPASPAAAAALGVPFVAPIPAK